MIANWVNANLYGSTADYRIFLFFTQYDCIELYSSKSQAEDAEKSNELKSVGKIEFSSVVVSTEFLALGDSNFIFAGLSYGDIEVHHARKVSIYKF